VLEAEMMTIGNFSASRPVLQVLCAVATFATLTIGANASVPVDPAANPPTDSTGAAQEPTQTAKPEDPGTPALEKSGVDPNAVPPATSNQTPDDRELVIKRMALCRMRPELCVQRGEKHDQAEAEKPDAPPRDR
jgi:hypothetical protein